MVHRTSIRIKAATKRKRQAKPFDKKRLFLRGGIVIVAVFFLVQLLYPSNILLPFTKIDGIVLGGKTRKDAVAILDKRYANHTIGIYMGNEKKPVTTPKLADMDISVNNAERINSLTYPWYLRIIPSSILWAGLKQPSSPTPNIGNKTDDYVNAKLMPNCQVAPTDASLKPNGAKLDVISAVSGGQCAQNDVMKSIKSVRPVMTKPTAVRVTRKEIAPKVTNSTAAALGKELTERLVSGLPLVVNDQTVTVPTNEVFSWLDFASDDTKLIAHVNADRAGSWLDKNIANKVAVKPGVSRITTVDFTETSRTNGENGKALDISSTIQQISAVITGESKNASAQTKVVPPTEVYTRTYSSSDTGLNAVMANFAKDHPGTYGATMVELDGKKRRASYNGDKQFVTASTYKLFVAYSLLKQIDTGKRDWSANEACFNKMISLSDNACAEGFLNSLGLRTVSDDIQAIGLKDSTFMKSGGPFTTANDLALELGMIATGQNFSSANQQRLLSAMKNNVYRKGIPAGVNGMVADKVGFMDGLLHDAAIVYSPHGTYVLAIMTNGSSWENIADLAKQLDQLHAQ